MQKKRKRIYILGIPLKAEPGDPVGPPNKFWAKVCDFLFHVFMVCLILAFYLWFGVLPAHFAAQEAQQEVQEKALTWTH